jgi:hypothetical protein
VYEMGAEVTQKKRSWNICNSPDYDDAGTLEEKESRIDNAERYSLLHTR